MAVKRLCDCCGKEITKNDFMVLNLLPKQSIRGISFDNPPVSRVSNQELCDACAGELVEFYMSMIENNKG